MAYGRGKRDNEYARIVHDIDAPKTVWMAIAVAFADRLAGPVIGPGGGQLEDVRGLIEREWQALFDNGIVPQKPRRGYELEMCEDCGGSGIAYECDYCMDKRDEYL